MSRLLLLCAVFMLGGFAVGRYLLRPQAAEATVAPAPLAAATDAGASESRPEAPAPAGERDTLLYVRAGERTHLTRTHGPLTLTLDDVPGSAIAPDPITDPLSARWRLRLARPGRPVALQTVAGYAVTGVMLVQLDADALYEALVLTYTGGAHCCTTYHAFDEVRGAWRRDSVEAGSFVFELRDLDGDGAAELVSEDPRFEYAFGSFAGSRGASRIVALRDGRLREATTEAPFRPALLAHRDRLRATLPETEGNPDSRRGLLAALAAQEALLGAAQPGFAFTARAYQEPDRADFLRDLRGFLSEHAFVTPAEGRLLAAE